MVRVPRFFLSPLPLQGRVELPSAERHQALNVLRLRAGDLVELFDGTGAAVRAVVVQAAEPFIVEILAGNRREERSKTFRIGLAFAVLKPKGTTFLLQKCTEAGANDFFPLVSDRSLPARAAGPDRLSRWEKIVREAAKQCGRPDLPVVHPPFLLQHLPERLAAAGYHDLLLASLDDRGVPLPDALSGRALEAAAVAIGPEGGWTPVEERRILETGARAVRLGRHVLRAETAALAAAATLAMWSLSRYNPLGNQPLTEVAR